MILLQDGKGLAGALAELAQPWADVYGDYKAVSAAVTFFHLVPLIVAAGAAFSADRATLRAAGTAARAQQLRSLAAIHRVVLFGLALSVVSGVLLLLSDAETFVGSIFLGIKLACVTLLLANGFLMTRTETALSKAPESERLWMRMRVLALTSATLWLATTLAGVLLREYA